MADPQTIQPVGLINSAPGTSTALPGTAPPVTGGSPPVQAYNPASANPAAAAATPYTVAPNQTVASQIKDIIAEKSPLMQQAEAYARDQMNQRGLINSSQAVTAGHSAVISAATPIATADAATYDRAASNTAAAKNTAALQNAQAETQTSQFNAGQSNAALSQAQQIQGSTHIAEMQSDTTKAIASLQASTNLSIEEKQNENNRLIASMNNENARALQEQQNAGNLEAIKAKGGVDANITQLTNASLALRQTSSGATQLYNTALTNLAAIVTNANLSEEQKAAALNDGVQHLNDALSVLSTIAGTPDVQSMLTFGTSADAAAAPAEGAAAEGAAPEGAQASETETPATGSQAASGAAAISAASPVVGGHISGGLLARVRAAAGAR